MLTKHQQSGVTLIELMIGLAIFVILAVATVPAFSGWVQNQRVRGAAEAILNGIQLARIEAVRRNSPVEFRLSGVRAGWQVQAIKTLEQVQARSDSEDSPTIMIDLASAVVPSGAASLVFNGLGRVMSQNPLDHSAPITEINVAASSGSDRQLRITVSSAGNVRMCDPHSPAGDPRAC